MINIQLGGAYIAPWEVEELPSEWIDAFTVMQDETRIQQNERVRQQAIDELFRKVRAEHPTYGKFVN